MKRLILFALVHLVCLHSAIASEPADTVRSAFRDLQASGSLEVFLPYISWNGVYDQLSEKFRYDNKIFSTTDAKTYYEQLVTDPIVLLKQKQQESGIKESSEIEAFIDKAKAQKKQIVEERKAMLAGVSIEILETQFKDDRAMVTFIVRDKTHAEKRSMLLQQEDSAWGISRFDSYQTFFLSR